MTAPGGSVTETVTWPVAALPLSRTVKATWSEAQPCAPLMLMLAASTTFGAGFGFGTCVGFGDGVVRGEVEPALGVGLGLLLFLDRFAAGTVRGVLLCPPEPGWVLVAAEPGVEAAATLCRSPGLVGT